MVIGSTLQHLKGYCVSRNEKKRPLDRYALIDQPKDSRVQAYLFSILLLEPNRKVDPSLNATMDHKYHHRDSRQIVVSNSIAIPRQIPKKCSPKSRLQYAYIRLSLILCFVIGTYLGQKISSIQRRLVHLWSLLRGLQTIARCSGSHIKDDVSWCPWLLGPISLRQRRAFDDMVWETAWKGSVRDSKNQKTTERERERANSPTSDQEQTTPTTYVWCVCVCAYWIIDIIVLPRAHCVFSFDPLWCPPQSLVTSLDNNHFMSYDNVWRTCRATRRRPPVLLSRDASKRTLELDSPHLVDFGTRREGGWQDRAGETDCNQMSFGIIKAWIKQGLPEICRGQWR